MQLTFGCVSPAQTIEFDEGAGAVLRIQPLRAPRDENIYECVAENSVDEITITAKLSIIRGKSRPLPPDLETLRQTYALSEASTQCGNSATFMLADFKGNL